MCFMDFRTIPFVRCWREATRSSQNIHRFRNHSKEELASFNRTRLKRENAGSHVIQF
jgi:hypothetical protein